MKVGNVDIKFPSFDGDKFAKALIVNKARSGAQKEVWPFLEALGGEATFRKAIQMNKPFVSTLDPTKFPPKWQEMIASAPDMAPLIARINDEDILGLLPSWLGRLVKTEPNGPAWWQNELTYLKSALGGG